MRVLFDLLHPAHFHLFRNVIAILKDRGDEVEIIARQKDCLAELLEKTSWPFHLIRRRRGGLSVLAWETLAAAAWACSAAKRQRIDIMAGTSISVGPAARLSGSVSVMFEEDDARVVPVFARLGYPLAHYVVTPRCLEYEAHGRKHLTYAGYQELAYLHPARFEPDRRILKVLGVAEGERYFVVRLVSLTAHHDIGQRGINRPQARRLVEHLAAKGRVFISAERAVDSDLRDYVLPLPAERIFDVLAFAEMVIGDSQTMAAEAAVLGTPSLRCNSFVGRLSYLEELEHKYGLTRGFRPEAFEQLLAQVDRWLDQPDLKQQWQQKRQVMLAESIDLTGWIVELFDRLVRK